MLEPEKTLAIILGVSECPRAPALQPLPHCANSASDFEDYLRKVVGLASGHILNLFDSKSPASEQLEKIEDWLSALLLDQESVLSDLIVYYTGHGGFSRNDQSYFLAVNRTRSGSEGATSIRYIDLSASIKRHAESVRKFLILDCCFAAAAVVRMQSSVEEMVSQRIEDELPGSGTAVLCSSAAKLVSIAPPGMRHTMFSGAFLKCLNEGIRNGPAVLSLEDLCQGTRRFIREQFPTDSVRPELHVPEQTKGNPASVPLFPNVMFRDEAETEPAHILKGDRLGLQNAVPDQRRLRDWSAIRSFLARYEFLLVGFLSGSLSALAFNYLPFPIGIKTTGYGVEPVAPVSPAVILLLALLYKLYRLGRLNVLTFSVLSVASYPGWAAAYSALYFSVIAMGGRQTTAMIVPAAAAAGFVGAFLLNLSFEFVTKGISRKGFRASAIKSWPLSVFAALSYFLSLLVKAYSIEQYLGLFIPWQLFFVANFTEQPIGKLRDLKRVAPIVAVALIATLNNPVMHRVFFEIKPAAVLFEVKSAKDRAVGRDLEELELEIEISKTLDVALNCSAEIEARDSVHTILPLGELDQGVKAITKTIDVRHMPESARARLICSAEGGVGYVTDWASFDVEKQK
ncbi:caspase family protein [Bradyrhizobium sp. USDA 4353]